MKTFITINGNTAYITKNTTLQQAKEFSIGHFDHSTEIIVREIDYLVGPKGLTIIPHTYHGRMQDFFRVALTRYSNNPIAEQIGIELLEHLSLLENS